MAGTDVPHENAHHLLRYPNATILILASILHWTAKSTLTTIRRQEKVQITRSSMTGFIHAAISRHSSRSLLRFGSMERERLDCQGEKEKDVGAVALGEAKGFAKSGDKGFRAGSWIIAGRFGGLVASFVRRRLRLSVDT
ncbi:hypothetical protein KCU93_g308, partial [Aureobasidium melanogenum]